MSTFFQSTPPAAQASGSPRPAVDCAPVAQFNALPHTALGGLNQSLGLHLDVPHCAWLQGYFREKLRREPTIGELRLLCAMEQSAAAHREHAAPETLATDSPELAETWADLMAHHAALHRGLNTALHETPVPPCTLADALSLPGRYLARTSDAPRAGKNDEQVLLLTDKIRVAEAAAAGYRAVATVVDDAGEARTVCLCRGRARDASPERSGDFLLLVRGVNAAEITAMLDAEAHKASPDIGDLRVIGRMSLLAAAMALGAGIELYAERIAGGAGDPSGALPLKALCATSEATCDLLVRVPVGRVYSLSAGLAHRGLAAVVVGRVRAAERVVIHLRGDGSTADSVAVDLPTELLAHAASVRLCAVTPQVAESAASVTYPSLARLPGVEPDRDGLTPFGREVVALTVHDARVLTVPEAHLRLCSTATTPAAGEGYRAALAAVEAAVEPLTEAGADARRMSLSVTLRAADETAATEAICGLYRAAAERGLPTSDPVLTVVKSDITRLSVTAWVHEPPEKTKRGKGKQPASPTIPVTYDAPDRQWNAVPKAVHKESTRYLLPVLRRSSEGSLWAVVAALGRTVGVARLIQPVVIDLVRETLPAPEDTPDAIPETVTREVLSPASVAALVGEMGKGAVPVFAMSADDAKKLLAEPTVREQLEKTVGMGYGVLVLGEACAAFAEAGLLPAEIADLRELTAPPTVAVDYHPVLEAQPATRLVRRALLAAARPVEGTHLLTLRLPDGKELPDGYLGGGGRVLGLLNGLDSATVSFCKH